ncbi:acetyltransferase, partial [Vibrio metoecus]|nr:acetyltransferase [Vibrio metoecus]MCR9746865.1 acetyltransferase [Vibrio cholerae]
SKIHQSLGLIILKIQLLAFKLHNLAFEFCLMLIW